MVPLQTLQNCLTKWRYKPRLVTGGSGHTRELLSSGLQRSLSLLLLIQLFRSPQMDFEVDGDGLFKHNDTYEYDGNYEYKDEAEVREAPAVVLAVLYLAVLLVGLLGNGLVLTALFRKRRSWSMSDTFVLHLCIADVLLLLTLPLWTAQALRQWEFGLAACKISAVLFYVSAYLLGDVRTWECFCLFSL